MKDIIWTTFLMIIIAIWCVLGAHLIIKSYNEAHYWECSVYVVTEYMLLNSLKEMINIKVDKNENKKGEK